MLTIQLLTTIPYGPEIQTWYYIFMQLAFTLETCPRRTFASNAQAFGPKPNALLRFYTFVMPKKFWLPGLDSN